MTEVDIDARPDAPSQLADASGCYQFHPLVYLPEGDEVTVGRAGNDDFIVLPEEGAALLRRLESGCPRREAADWFQATYGEEVDVDGFVADLAELGFVRRPGEPMAAQPTVRWQRLGRAVFSPVGAVCYALLIAAWLASMVRAPRLVPKPHNLIFTHYMSILMLTLLLAQMPLLLLHEGAHALAGRRLGLPSKLSVGRRLQFLVFETTMNGLVAVERKKRYLPILAGMMTDLAASAALGLAAAALGTPRGGLGQLSAIALSISYLTLLRFLWQFWFFLRTDIYYLVVTVLGCVDLHTAAKQQLANTFCRLRGRPARYDPESWHPRDRSVARWYAKLMFVGYAASVATLAFGWFPAFRRIVTTVVPRLFGHNPHGWKGLLDSITFLTLNCLELLLVAGLAFRERRRSRRPAPVPADR